MPGKVLITGANGYVGGWVTEAVVERGYDVFALGRRPSNSPQVINLIADLTDLEVLLKVLDGHKFDAVINLASAGQRQPKEVLYNINFQGTQNLMEVLARNPPKRIIHASSMKVYQNSHFGIITEKSVCVQGHETYGGSKFESEVCIANWANQIKAEWVVFRMSNSYGAPKSMDVSMWHLLFNDLCRQAVEHGEIKLLSPPDTPLDMVWLGTVSQVFAQAIEHPYLDGVYNLGCGHSTTIGEVARAVGHAYKQFFGRELRQVMPKEISATEPLQFVCDKLQAVLPYDVSPHFEAEAIGIFTLLSK